MTAKPRKSKSGRNFGTRRQYRRSRGKFGPFYSLDFETRAFVGVDFGYKDESVFVVAVQEGDGPLKLYPYQVKALSLLGPDTVPASLFHRDYFTGRDFYKEAAENWRKSGLLK